MSGELTAPQAAHVLRRLTFGPFPGKVEAALDTYPTADDLIDDLLDAPPVPFTSPAPIDVAFADADPEVLGLAALVDAWTGRMRSPDAGVHERMVWFWPTLFVTSTAKSEFLFVWHHQRKVHHHAAGNYRALAKELVVDASQLQFLDGTGTTAEAPNENLARELMELFMLGRGNYTEADVRAGARSLAGRTIDYETGRAEFDVVDGPTEPDTFLGTTAVFDSDLVIDTILEQPAAAPHLVSKLWRSFIGTDPDPELVATWAAQLRADDWEVKPLLARMLHSEAFAASANSRPRSGIEWAVAALEAGGIERIEVQDLVDLGQVPYLPPNVSGWPDDGWQAPSMAFARALFLSSQAYDLPSFSTEDDPVDAVLRWCGLFRASSATRAALTNLLGALDGGSPDDDALLLRTVLVSPEFSLA